MSLRDQLIERIRLNGPITVADYMTEALLHPEFGYYTTRDPLGEQGDFVTAPEISQMFGELVGLSLAQSWLDQGCPAPFTLAELGPGRGTLMSDILRATQAVPGFHDAANLCLIEASPTLRNIQKRTLAHVQPNWLRAVSELPGQPTFLVANEFFDALPIRQFLRAETGWSERLVGQDQGQLVFGLGAQAPQPALADRLNDTASGDLIELCPTASVTVADISERIARFGGAALIIDYGDWRSLGDTLQAVRAHAKTDPLADPGLADLTAHVDFEALATQCRKSGCAHSRLTPQGVFLERLGITQRAQQLAGPPGSTRFDDIAAAHRRLTHPGEMGNLFKVLGLFPTHATPPAGLVQ